jgi:hypothetical protein
VFFQIWIEMRSYLNPQMVFFLVSYFINCLWYIRIQFYI